MSKETTNAALDLALVETTSFLKTVKFKVPGRAKDSWREGEFVAEFKPMTQEEWEDLIETHRKSEVVLEILISAEGIPSAKTTDGEELSPVEVVARNPFTCDATFATYGLYVTENSRDVAQSAGERKNSRRSRRR